MASQTVANDKFGLQQTPDSIQQELDRGNLQNIADMFRLIKIGTMLAPLKVVVTSLGSSVTVVVTSAAVFAAATITGALATLAAYGLITTLPPIDNSAGVIVNVTGGSKQGAYLLADAAFTPFDAGASSVGVATLSDDGTTITFNTAVTGFNMWYVPRPATDMSLSLSSATPPGEYNG